MKWIPTDQQLPPDETPVLIVLSGQIRLGNLRWEHPSWEETFESFRFWDDPDADGQCWDWADVTHWMPLPELPGFDQGIEAAFWYAANPEYRPKVPDFSDDDDGIPF